MSTRVVILELAGQTYTEHRQRLRSDILGKQKILIESKAAALIIIGIEAVRERVMPAVFVYRTVFYRSYRIFPLIAGVEICALNYTSAGETEYPGIKIMEFLCEVFPKAAFTK